MYRAHFTVTFINIENKDFFMQNCSAMENYVTDTLYSLQDFEICVVLTFVITAKVINKLSVILIYASIPTI